jgi:hypothetical protein
MAVLALVLEMPSQHLDGLWVRREEAIVLRRETLGEGLVRRGRFLDRGVVKGLHHHGADQYGREQRRENRAGDQDRLQARAVEHRLESNAVGAQAGTPRNGRSGNVRVMLARHGANPSCGERTCDSLVRAASAPLLEVDPAVAARNGLFRHTRRHASRLA